MSDSLFDILFVLTLWGSELGEWSNSYGCKLVNMVSKGMTDDVITLLEANPRLGDCSFPLGNTLLHISAEYDDIRLVDKLLSLGVNPNRITENFYTPLLYSLLNNNTPMVHLLLDYGADVRTLYLFTDRFMDYWRATGDDRTMQYLLDNSTLELLYAFGVLYPETENRIQAVIGTVEGYISLLSGGRDFVWHNVESFLV